MSQAREPSYGPFKACNFVVFSIEKPSDILFRVIRCAVLIFLVTSLSLVLYSAVTGQTRWFPFSEGAAQYSGGLYGTTDYISGDNLGETNISHVQFGIAGSVATWKDRRHYSELWWKPNVSRGYVWLDGKPDAAVPWPKSSPPYRVSEDWSRFKYSSSQSAVRIARIVSESFRVGLPNVRWFVMGDDDTVFFTENLVSVLAKYDHRQVYYIGANSESVEQDVMHSYGMAFGGGGFAVSYGLAAKLATMLDGCLDRYYRFYGSDQRIWACVSEIGVSLTTERGFHQMDIRGDPYGLLAAHPVAPLVSLHHIDAVSPMFPSHTHLDSLKSLFRAYQVDPARILQQSFCYDHRRNWSISVSWGYTAQLYPWLVPAHILDKPLQTFQTWRSRSQGPFTFNTRQVTSDPCEQPVIYFLEEVREVAKGETMSSYGTAVAQPEKACQRPDYAPVMAVQRIKVSTLKMSPQDWKKAPRRQCSEIVKLKDSTLQVKIRSCKP